MNSTGRSKREQKLDSDYLLKELELILLETKLEKKRTKIMEIMRLVPDRDDESDFPISTKSLKGQIEQMLKSRTSERVNYYAERLRKSLEESRTTEYSDINLRRWKEYEHIRTDSLWNLGEREKGVGQDASYWGNFVPEIPKQLIQRYSKKGEWVLDPFLGSGTTMIEAIKLGRNCIGVDVNSKAVSLVKEKLLNIVNHDKVRTEVMKLDSRKIRPDLLKKKCGVSRVHLAILHPPYHDIIKFSDLEEDLSAADSIEKFTEMFNEVLRAVDSVLENGRFLAVVIGDKYTGGELVPLSHILSKSVTDLGYIFKSIIVKNFDKTKGKRGSEKLWKYRALAGGFYVFKHEYILIFRKKGQ